MKQQTEISRVKRSKQSAMATYDNLSRSYDWFASGSELSLTRLGMKKLNLQPGEQVLEIGSGTGQSLPALASALGDEGLVFGLVLSPSVLAVARKMIANTKAVGKVCLSQADGVHPPCILFGDSMPAG